MNSLVADKVGLVHLIASIFALLFGTLVLLLKKGTRRHKKIGYAYLTSMTILLVTFFMIYRLFSGFGIFHYSAVVSSLTIGFGMIPILTKRPKNTYVYLHFAFMYWSVIGLYCAFVSEIFTRIPETPFYKTMALSTFSVVLIAAIFFGIKQQKWKNNFELK